MQAIDESAADLVRTLRAPISTAACRRRSRPRRRRAGSSGRPRASARCWNGSRASRPRLDRADHGRDRDTGRNSSPAPSTRGRQGPGAPWSRSTAPRCLRGSSPPSCSATRGGRSQAPSKGGGAGSSWRRGARSSSTRRRSCRPRSRSPCCASFRSASSSASAARDAADGRTCGRGDQPEPRGSRARGKIPHRPLFPPQRVPDPRAGAARAGGRHPPPRRVLGEPVLAQGRQGDKADRRSAMAALCAYPWPGNIRELQNVVERAVILARGTCSTSAISSFPASAPSLLARRAPPPGRAPADRRGARREPRPRLWPRRRGGDARGGAQHAGVAHPPPRDRQARLPPPRAQPRANGPTPQGTRGRAAGSSPAAY